MRAKQTAPLVNKHYYNEVTFRGQNLSWKLEFVRGAEPHYGYGAQQPSRKSEIPLFFVFGSGRLPFLPHVQTGLTNGNPDDGLPLPGLTNCKYR